MTRTELIILCDLSLGEFDISNRRDGEEEPEDDPTSDEGNDADNDSLPDCRRPDSFLRFICCKGCCSSCVDRNIVRLRLLDSRHRPQNVLLAVETYSNVLVERTFVQSRNKAEKVRISRAGVAATERKKISGEVFGINAAGVGDFETGRRERRSKSRRRTGKFGSCEARGLDKIDDGGSRRDQRLDFLSVVRKRDGGRGLERSSVCTQRRRRGRQHKSRSVCLHREHTKY